MSRVKCPGGLSPDCTDGNLPICTDTRPDGSRYSHAETCATYTWAADLCAACNEVFLRPAGVQ